VKPVSTVWTSLGMLLVWLEIQQQQQQQHSIFSQASWGWKWGNFINSLVGFGLLQNLV